MASECVRRDEDRSCGTGWIVVNLKRIGTHTSLSGLNLKTAGQDREELPGVPSEGRT